MVPTIGGGHSALPGDRAPGGGAERHRAAGGVQAGGSPWRDVPG